MPTDSLHTAVTEAAVAPRSYEPPHTFSQTYQQGLSTVLVDSIEGDTVEGRIPHFIPAEEADSLRREALVDSLAEVRIPEVPSGVSEGVAPEALPPSYVHSTSLTAIMMGSLILAAFNADSVLRVLKSYKSELWSVRRRPNVFDDERGVPLHIAAILSIIYIIFGGVVLYNVHGVPTPPTFAGAAASMGLLGVYYLFELGAYWLVGYTFTGEAGLRRWLGGFAATRAFAGLALIVPALMLIYQPQWWREEITVSVSIFILSHLLFIIKGFRIFYKNFCSLFYFILYLCTLEILPVLLVYRLAGILTTEI